MNGSIYWMRGSLMSSLKQLIESIGGCRHRLGLGGAS